MEGRIYIAGSFKEISLPASKSDWRDNCPHFWSSPPTWGICRPDFRGALSPGDYVFFVLPKTSPLPQMVFAYMKIKEIISHHDAFNRNGLQDKRMGNKNPNGNILVDATGNYNRFDNGQHKKGFNRIKQHFAVGDVEDSEFLSEPKVKRKAPSFQAILNQVFSKPNALRPIDVLGRSGRVMDDQQIFQLLSWLKK